MLFNIGQILMRMQYIVVLVALMFDGRVSRGDHPATYIVSGQVIQGDQPQPGLTVRVIGSEESLHQKPSLTSEGQLVDPWKEIANCQTDGSGRFRLELMTAANQGFVKVELPEHSAVYRTFNFRGGANPNRTPSYTDQQITVPTFVRYRVKILDSQRKPIQEAAVHRMTGFRQGVVVNPDSFAESEKTNADGDATMMLESGEIQTLWVRAKGHLGRSVVVRPENPSLGTSNGVSQHDVRELKADEAIELVLSAAKSIRGRVVSDKSGMGVPETSVLLQSSLDPRTRFQLQHGDITATTMEIRSGTDGRFYIPEVPNLPFSVYASKNGRFITRQYMNPADGSETDLGDLELGEGDLLRGQLLDVDTGSPVDIAGGKIEVSNFQGGSFFADIDGTGYFECLVPKFFGGQARLMEHSEFESFPIYGMIRTDTREYPIYVQRRPSVLSDAEIIELLPTFLEEYQIPDGKIVRRVSRPYSKSREAFYQAARFRGFLPPTGVLEIPYMHMRRAMPNSGKPSSPYSAIYLQNKQDQLKVIYSTHGFQTVHQLLSPVFVDLNHSRIKNLVRFDAPPLPLGEFVFRTERSLEEVVVALNETFQEEPRVPVKLSIVRQKFMTLVVHDRPADAKFYSSASLKVVPEGYDGPTRGGNYQMTWARMIGSLADELGLQWKCVQFDDQGPGDIRIETPEALRSGDTKTREELRLKMRESVAKVLHDSLGVKAEIQEVELPVVVISPLP